MARPKQGSELGGMSVTRRSARPANQSAEVRRIPDLAPRAQQRIRRVGRKTALHHPHVAKFRGSLTRVGHEVQLAVEHAQRVKWPKTPAVARRADRLDVREHRWLLADNLGRCGLGRLVEVRKGGGKKRKTLYVFERLNWRGARIARFVAVPPTHVLVGQVSGV